MRDVLILGLDSAAIYAVAASGLVVTYTTSGIFNFAHGAVAMMAAFVYWQLTPSSASALPVGIAMALTLVVITPGALVVQVVVQVAAAAAATAPPVAARSW